MVGIHPPTRTEVNHTKPDKTTTTTARKQTNKKTEKTKKNKKQKTQENARNKHTKKQNKKPKSKVLPSQFTHSPELFAVPGAAAFVVSLTLALALGSSAHPHAPLVFAAKAARASLP